MHANLKHIVGAFSLAIMSFCIMPATSYAQSSKIPAGKFCAKENGKCRFSGPGLVYYGAGDKWTRKRIKSGVPCSNRYFGDPAPNKAKSCWVNQIPFSQAPQGTRCAKEGGICKFKGEATVYYGAGKRWFALKKKDGVRCSNGAFGDPSFGQPKSCFVRPKSSHQIFTQPMGPKCADEGGVCQFRGSAVVYYGYGKSWHRKTATNGVKCNNATFGDPKPGTKKVCTTKANGRTTSVPSSTPQNKIQAARGIKCATENQVCEFKRSANVYYGAKNSWVVKRFNNKKARCSNKVFGDPAPGVVKSCWAVPVN